MVRIETERLVLRRMQDDDLQDFLEYESQPEHTRYLSRDGYSEDKAREFIATARDLSLDAEGTYLHLAVELKSSGKMIGTVCVKVLSRAHGQGDVGWFLRADHQGQGLATEASRAILTFAFTELDLHRVTAHCDAMNARSRRMMERLGMRQEAFYKDAAFFDDAWHSQYGYAVLRQEWERGTAQPAPGGDRGTQLVLYLYSKSTNMRSALASWMLYDATRSQAPQLPSQEPPYESVLSAVADGWRIVQFPDARQYSYQGVDNDYLGFEFILEKMT